MFIVFLQKFIPESVWIGYLFRHVCRANSEEAIETLMLADSLFRSQDIATRKKYVKLVESVREQVVVLPSQY